MKRNIYLLSRNPAGECTYRSQTVIWRHGSAIPTVPLCRGSRTSAFARTIGERIDAALDQAGVAGACLVLAADPSKSANRGGRQGQHPMHHGERTSSVAA